MRNKSKFGKKSQKSPLDSNIVYEFKCLFSDIKQILTDKYFFPWGKKTPKQKSVPVIADQELSRFLEKTLAYEHEMKMMEKTNPSVEERLEYQKQLLIKYNE